MGADCMQFLPIFIIFIPVLTSLILYLLKNQWGNRLVFLAQAIMTVLAIVYFSHYYNNFDATYFVIGQWDSRIGISLINDEISMIFIFLTLFAWWVVLLYVFDKKVNYNFLFFLMFLQGVFLGLLQTNDLFNMFVFVELTTIIVTILIAFKKTGYTFRSALYYLMLNTSGVLLFLIGISLIYFTFGTINIQEVSHNMDLYKDSTIIRLAFVLMMAGISVKSALFPVFTWLPKAHGAAKSGVSALLSGLIVKGGLYLFIRITDMFSGAEIPYQSTFFILGALTGFLGITFAIAQKDIKQMLAYSTVSQIGLIVMGLSFGEGQVYAGGILHIVNHAIFKMMLFMIAGIIIKVYLSKEVHRIRGMFKAMPFISSMMIIAMLAITGFPFLNGYVSKSVIMYGFDEGIHYWVVFFMNIGTATLFVKMSQIFFGPSVLSYPIGHFRQSITLFILMIALVGMGNYFVFFEGQFLGVDFSNVSPASISAFVDFFITIGLGVILYYYVVRKDVKLFKILRKFTLSFEHANYIFVVYTVVLITIFLIIGVMV